VPAEQISRADSLAGKAALEKLYIRRAEIIAPIGRVAFGK
jgi:hypothetical protein